MNEPHFTITEVQDEEEIADFRVQHEQARRNSEWLQGHWQELLPQALGKFLAVAGQQAFIADTSQQAWQLAQEAHPQDRGILLQYVRPQRGPRFYGNRG